MNYFIKLKKIKKEIDNTLESLEESNKLATHAGIEWTNITPLDDNINVKEIISKELEGVLWQYDIPKDLIDLVKNCGGGKPKNKKKFETESGDVSYFGRVMTLNNIIETMKRVFKRELIFYIPFAQNSFGQYLCCAIKDKEKKVVVYDPENRKTQIISKTITELLKKLY